MFDFCTRRILRRLERGLEEMANRIQQIIEEIRQSKSVQDGLIVQNRELRAALKSAQEALNDAEVDESEVQDAIALLDAMEAEGNAALTENTDTPPFTPSGN